MFKKLKENAKKLLVALLSATTTGSGLVAFAVQTASAAEDWVLSYDANLPVPFIWGAPGQGSDGQMHEGSYYNYNNITMFALTNTNTGQKYEVFCIEPGVWTTDGNTYSGGDTSGSWDRLGTSIQQKIGAWYAYSKTYHDGDFAYRAAVQLLVWNEALKISKSWDSTRDINWTAMETLVNNNTSRYNQTLYNQIRSAYNEMESYYANTYGKKPSFSSTTVDINPGGDSVRVTDNNGVLHLDEWQVDMTGVPAGISIVKSGDDLVITADKTAVGHYSVTFKLVHYKQLIDRGLSRTIVFTSTQKGDNGSSIQQLANPGTVDPETPTLTLNVTSGKIVVEKYDQTSFAELEGARFEIRDDEGTLVSELTTNQNGQAMTDWLPYGNYTVKEVGAPKGYNLSVNTTQSVTVNSETQTVEFYNKIIQGTAKVIKVNAKNNNTKIAGAEFQIYKVAGIDFDNTYAKPVLVDTITTEEDGTALSGLLDYGRYYLVESNAAYGYYNDQIKYYFDITEEGKTVPFTISNEPITSKIIITKKDSNSDGYGLDEHGEKRTLEGAEFELWEHVVHRRGADGTIIAESESLVYGPVVTNAEGIAVIEDKMAVSSALQQDGSYYYLKEVKAPHGYELNEEKVNIEFRLQGQFVKVVEIEATYENDPILGKIEIIKTDKETGKSLTGAKYEITNEEGQVIDTVTVGSGGKVTAKGLRMGTYTVTEISAPLNYQNDAKPQTVKLEVSNKDGVNLIETVKVEFKNTHNKGTLLLTKVDGLTVDYKQTCTNPGDLATCTVIATPTEDTVFLPGVKFAIYAKDNLSKAVAEGVTNDQGIVSFTLNTGEYYYQELEAPEGYAINPKLVPFTLGYNGDKVEQIVSNMVIYGSLKVYKIGETLTGVEVDEDGVTNLIWKDTFMPNAKFELYADEDIIHPITGDVLYEKDELVREIITDENGEATVENLALGRYYVKEVIAPEEHSVYEATSDVKYVELTEENVNFEGVVEAEATFVNERIIIDPSIYKVGASPVNPDEEVPSEYTYTPLEGVKFGIYNAEEINNLDIDLTQADIDTVKEYLDNKDEVILTEDDFAKYDIDGDEEITESDLDAMVELLKSALDNEDAVVVPADTLLAIMTTDEEGFADVQVKLPFGKYYVKELEAVEGYYLDEEKHPFELVWEQEMQENNILAITVADEENPIINYEIIMPKTGINKTSIYTLADVATIAVCGLAIALNRKTKENN